MPIINGLQIDHLPAGFSYVQKYVGEKNVPQDIKMTRKSSFEVMRRMGTPVVIKALYTHDDVLNGIAEESPNFDDVYGQTRGRDELSYGAGFVSKEKSDTEWINLKGEIVTEPPPPPPPPPPEPGDPEPEPEPVWPPSKFKKAPKYRGFGPGYLTYIIQPDVTEDWYQHTEEGTFTRVQSAMVQAPWWPEVHDGDLITEVTLDQGGHLLSTGARYEAKMSAPNSIRGLDRRGRQEFNSHPNRHVINQQFEMSRLPDNHALMEVEMDR